MTPGERHSVTPNTDLNTMHVHRPVITTAYVVFAAPDQFDWRSTKTLRDQRRFARYVRIGRCTASKTAAGKLRMETNLVRPETKHFGNHYLVHCLELRRHPRFRFVTFEFDSCVERLHWRMGQKRKLILGNNTIRTRHTIHHFR